MKIDKKILQRLKELMPTLKKQYGIEKMAIFGSVARGEDRKKSDLDLVILKASKKNGFLLMRAKIFLSKSLNRNIDLGYYDAMNSFIKKEIERDLVYV